MIIDLENVNDSHHWFGLGLWCLTALSTIIRDNYLLNVYTDCYYSNSLISRVCWTKVKILIKLHHIRTQTTIFPFANINLELGLWCLTALSTICLTIFKRDAVNKLE
jgi:hypothetical protein